MPRFRADLGQLSRIREIVTESATELGVSSDALDDIRLAVDEAVTNIIVHGYDGAGEIGIEITASGNDLVVRLRDRAPVFDSASAAPADLASTRERNSPGGFGLFLMRQAMDEIVHRALSGGNELTMVKKGVIHRDQLTI